MVRQITVTEVIENDDGSANVTFECDDESRQTLIGIGLLTLIEKAITEKKGTTKDED